MKRTLVVALLLLGTAVGAQTTASKKELVAKLLQLQQSAIERSAIMMIERPAATMMQQAGVVLQTRIPPDKREAIAKDMQSDVKKYADELVPLVRERAVKLAPSTIGVLMEEKFTEDELKQIITITESPVYRRYQQVGAEFEKALIDKLVAELRSVIDPKVRALDQALVARLGIPAKPAQAAASGTARPAKAASQ